MIRNIITNECKIHNMITNVCTYVCKIHNMIKNVCTYVCMYACTRRIRWISGCAKSVDVTTNVFTSTQSAKSSWLSHTHTHTHTRAQTHTHARTHTHTITHTPFCSLGQTCSRRQNVWWGWRLSRQYRNIFTKRFSCNDVLRLLSRQILLAMLPKFVRQL